LVVINEDEVLLLDHLRWCDTTVIYI
jgi:hypothetical protein